MPRRLRALAVLMSFVVIACGDGSSAEEVTTSTTFGFVETVSTGTVIAVDGTLAGIDGFTLRLEDGTDLALVPAEGLLFDGTAPLSHVQDHLVSGSPVSVTYLAGGDPPYSCTEIGDARSDGHPHDD